VHAQSPWSALSVGRVTLPHYRKSPMISVMVVCHPIAQDRVLHVSQDGVHAELPVESVSAGGRLIGQKKNLQVALERLCVCLQTSIGTQQHRRRY